VCDYCSGEQKVGVALRAGCPDLVDLMGVAAWLTDKKRLTLSFSSVRRANFRPLCRSFCWRETPARRGARPEPFRVSRSRFGYFFCPAFWRRSRFQRLQQPPGRRRNLFDRCLERRLIILRRMVKPANLAHELQRRRPHIFRLCRRLKVKQRFYISAHGNFRLAKPVPAEKCLRSCISVPHSPV